MPSSPAKTPGVALCVICRDNSATIDALLASVTRAKRPDGTLVGYAFDEYVFVDTGSRDDTEQKIATAFGVGVDAWPARDEIEAPRTFEAPAIEGAVDDPRWGRTAKVTFSRFQWIEDFSAARNYCFGLAGTPWRMYLDTDDSMKVAGAIRSNLIFDLTQAPHINCVTMLYHYDQFTMQDEPRLVKWTEGFRWKGRLHEKMARSDGGPAIIAPWKSFVVEHHRRTPDQVMKQLERNDKIAREEYAQAKASGDVKNAARIGFSIAHHELAVGNTDAAITLFDEAAIHLAGTNFGARARLAQGDLLLAAGRNQEAIEAFGAAVGQDPTLPEPMACLAIAYMKVGPPHRAESVLSMLGALKPSVITTVMDTSILVGRLPAWAALHYAQQGDFQKAQEWLTRWGRDVADAESLVRGRDAAIAVAQDCVLSMLEQYVQTVAATDDTERIPEILDNVPETIEGHPRLQALREWAAIHLRHLNSWDQYRACYSSLPAATYDPTAHNKDAIRTFGRTQALLDWAARQPTDATPRVLCIGPQDCNIEAMLLEAHPGIHLTVADASVLAGGATQALSEAFPGRVATHRIEENELDWPPGRFDLVYCFEVIEHLPDLAEGLIELRARVAPGGTLLLSTPHAKHWMTYDHVKPDSKHDWWAHVRAQSPTSLYDVLRHVDINDARIETTDNDSVILVEWKRSTAVPEAAGEASVEYVVFVVPGPFPAFDDETLTRRHVGGSEEAVIHLTRSLAARGVACVVYAPLPALAESSARFGSGRLYSNRGVLYRDISEFSLRKWRTVECSIPDAVVFWRCAGTAAAEVREDRKLAAAIGDDRPSPLILNWLHDVTGGGSPDDYKEVDGSLVLSSFHQRAITKYDLAGDDEGIPFLRFQNGIVQEDYFEGAPTRDPAKVIYCSSPDRGLERLLKLWPRVKREVPEATLDIYYSWEMLRQRRPDEFERMTKLVEAVADLGVTYKGGVDHSTLRAALSSAGVFAYPTVFEEISCIAAAKAQAAGLAMVTTDYAALDVTVKAREYVVPAWRENGIEAHDDGFLNLYGNVLIAALQDSIAGKVDREAIRDGVRSYLWSGQTTEMFFEAVAEAANNRSDRDAYGDDPADEDDDADAGAGDASAIVAGSEQ